MGFHRVRGFSLELQVIHAATHFPFEPGKAHVLPVDHPLTYERLASYGFDPNSEYLYALELR